jgi:multidrug efflux pump subunit AcrA (membrane-fusion protein)
VEAGAVLATLDDRDLKLDRVRWLGEVAALDRRYREALALHKRAEMNLFGAQLAQAKAQLDLTDYKLARTRITAPIAGVVVSGDVSQLVGTPIEEGKLLFEVAPLEAFRVVLKVAEGDVRYVRAGQTGAFAPTGLAGGTVPFTVTKLTSVTSAEDGRNVFRVEAALDRARAGALRPGMEGVAKVGVDRASRLWIWTRGVRDWFSLFLWKWLP